MDHRPDCPLPEGVRARLWVSPHALGARDLDARLWLVLADGRVLALRLPQVATGDDAVIAPLIGHLGPDERGMLWSLEDAAFGYAHVLYAAPVVPPLDSGHAACALEAGFQRFVAALDGEVIALLQRLMRLPHPAAITRPDGQAPHPLPRPFFLSIRNYNRLATLPPGLRERRMQALARFPALVAPILLTAHRYSNAFDGKRHAWREKDLAVEAAIDAGRDLTGVLAAHYGISRGLVRHALNAEYWHAASHATRRGLLALLDELPDNRRPTLAEFERWMAYLPNYFMLIGEDEEGDPLPQPTGVHRGAFRLGWAATWARAARRHGDLHPALADCDDFLESLQDHLRARLRRRRGVKRQRLAQGWLACHGLLGLLAASARWHRQRPQGEDFAEVPPGFELPTILGEVEENGATARELVTPQALAEEGRQMAHCVGGYWPRCVDGERIFALALANGERATAQYRPTLARERDCDTVYHLAQLRGPHNAAVSADMERWANAVEERLNAPALQSLRWQALEARGRLEVAQLDWRLQGGVPAAGLDAKTQRELAAVCRWLGLNPPEEHVLLIDFVAGFQYHAGPGVEYQLRRGDVLTLVRERDNPHDANAVRIDWQGNKLGYVSHDASAPIAAALERGEGLQAHIARIDLQAEPWRRVEICVRRA